MNIISIDDEILANMSFEMIISEINIDCNYLSFSDPFKALEYIRNNHVDIVFSDIEMPNMSGIELTKQIKKISSDTKIVFTTGYESYALDAFKINAIGYLLKPFTKEDVLREINKAKKITSLPNIEKKVYVRTFGNFDLFVNGKLVIFNRNKAKEILALLIDKKGGFISSNQIMAYLFEDCPITESMKSNYRNIRCSLQSTLANYGIEDILIYAKGGCSIDKDKVSCDYYDFLNNDSEAKKSFQGEYMSNYSWAEDTLAYLLNNY